MKDLDIALLRSFVAIAETGGFARAGERVGRTQSTISLQMKRLEEQAAVSLFRRDGRRMVLTEDGHALMHYARRILALNDEARARLNARAVEGVLRFGTVQDMAETALPGVLSRFALGHPASRLEVHVADSRTLRRMLKAGRLDLALAAATGRKRETVVRREPLIWIGNGRAAARLGEPVPLAVCDQSCGIRKTMIGALKQAQMPYRLAFTSPSLDGLRAAVRAGLGLTARTRAALRPGLVAIDRSVPMPPLPEIEWALIHAKKPVSRAADRLHEILEAAFSGSREPDAR